MTLGETIKTARQERKWSQEELASRSGVSRNHVAGVEKGNNISIELLEKIAAALDLRELPLGRVRLVASSEDGGAPWNASLISSLAEQIHRTSTQLLSHVHPGRDQLASVTPITVKRSVNKDIFEMTEDELRAAGVPFAIPKEVHPLEGEMVDVYGYVAAGPHGYEEIPPGSEKVFIPRHLLPQADEKILIAKGESMIDFGIKDGDVVVVKPRKGGVAARGEIVVAWLNDGCVIKEWQRREGKKLLVSHNPSVPPIELTPDDVFELQAVVRRWFSATWEVNFAPKVSG